jgi:hypothetical protein
VILLREPEAGALPNRKQNKANKGIEMEKNGWRTLSPSVSAYIQFFLRYSSTQFYVYFS